MTLFRIVCTMSAVSLAAAAMLLFTKPEPNATPAGVVGMVCVPASPPDANGVFHLACTLPPVAAMGGDV